MLLLLKCLLKLNELQKTCNVATDHSITWHVK